MKLIFFVFSISCFAIDQKESKELFKSYLESIRSSDKSKLEKVITKEYFNELSKKKLIEEMFKMNKKSNEKIDFDISIKKAALQKNLYYVNIKNKSDKHFGHNWFRVIRLKDKYKIDGTEFFD